MKTLLAIYLTSIFFCLNHDVSSEVFIYEPSPKIDGQSTIGFVIIENSKIKEIVSYKIYFNDSKIKKVDNGGYPLANTYSFVKDKNGNVNVKEIDLLAYTDNNFKSHMVNKEKLYTLINKDFVIKSNIHKKEILDNLLLKKN